MNVRRSDEVVILGGGVVGVCCAYYLAIAGCRVRLLERAALASGSSYGNSGLLTPSAAYPINMPGIIPKSIKWMLSPNGAFRFKPRPSLQLVRWLRLFQQHCTEAEVNRVTPLLRDMIQGSLALFRELARLPDANLFEFSESGTLALYKSEYGQHQAQSTADLLRRFDIVCQPVDSRQVRELVPHVKPAVRGATFFPEDAHLIPGQFVKLVARAAEAAGATIETLVGPAEIESGPNHQIQVRTSSGVLSAEKVVVATGAWAPFTVRRFGLWLPIEPGKGYSLEFRRGLRTNVPLRLTEARAVVSAMGDSIRMTARLDLVGMNSSVTRRAESIVKLASKYLDVSSMEEPTGWAGLRPLTPDSLPIVGPHPSEERLVLAVGHGQLGVTLGPVTGRLVADFMTGKNVDAELAPLRADRFQRQRTPGTRQPSTPCN
jgi:D-amino-acid dehydrogenase